jgi:L-alanine-DL-glutamate epimerase-like enolase superfamily enzyme
MKIKRIEQITSGRSLFVRVTTDDGLTGIGEGSLNSRVEAVSAVLKSLEEVVVGKDASNIEHLWQDIFRGTFWRGGPVLMSALSALDAALWDIKGKALNTPVYNLLGGKCRDKIRMYSHCGGGTTDELCRNAEEKLKLGYRVLRICPHDNFSDGFYEPGVQVRKSVLAMKQLREFVGPEVEIIFEVHTRLSPVRAIELCNSIAEYHPIFVEDPIRADSPENFRVLRSHTNTPLGTGEKFGAIWDYKTLIEEDLIDYVRTDVCNCGGISSMRKTAAYAEAHYMEMVPHGLPSAAGMMAALHTDMATPNFCMQESGLYSEMNRCLRVDAEFKDGFMYLGDAPGLGITLDDTKCEPFHNAEHPHWRREDGTVQDW